MTLDRPSSVVSRDVLFPWDDIISSVPGEKIYNFEASLENGLICWRDIQLDHVEVAAGIEKSWLLSHGKHGATTNRRTNQE